MRLLRRRLGVPLEAAEKILETSLEVGRIVGGGLGVRRGDGYVEIIVDRPVARFTPTSLTPLQPNSYSIGEPGNYLSDVVSANLTIPSQSRWKRGVRPADPSLWDIPLPYPKTYTRSGGAAAQDRMELGILAEELPPHLRTPGGYSLNTLTAILVGKVRKLEGEVEALKGRLERLEKKFGVGLAGV